MSRALVEYDPLSNPAQSSLSFKAGPLGYERKAAGTVVPTPDSINDGIQILTSALERWRAASGFEVPVVIVDEFDRLEKDKELFGDFHQNELVTVVYRSVSFSAALRRNCQSCWVHIHPRRAT